MAEFTHTPVMVGEVVELFGPVPAGVLVDATVGGGGHAEALLSAHDHLSLLGLDRDEDALAASSERLAGFGDRVTLRHTRFDHLTEEVHALGIDQVSGVLCDLGVSSPQLDRPDRGFSYRSNALLDMRMDRTQERTAADLVNTWSESELAALLRDAGDERFARLIARAIVANRPIERTDELAEVVRSAIPAPARRRGGDPARRSFQALRIGVNDELEMLEGTLEQAIDLLRPNGRAAVLAYHSGEDVIVKRCFRTAATGDCHCPPHLPCGCGAHPTVRLLKQGAWKPSAAEVAANRRAESARLRAVEKLPQEEA